MRILFITSSRIGDAILSTGILNYLIKKSPASQVTIACGHDAGQVFKAIPNIKKLILIKKRRYSMHWLSLWLNVFPTSWDIIIDLRSSAISFLLFGKEKKIFKKNITNVNKVVSLSMFYGLESPSSPKIFINKINILNSEKLIPSEKKVIAIGPTSNWGGKQWPPEYFIDFISRISGKNGKIRDSIIAIFGLPNEVGMIRPLLNYLEGMEYINLIGKTDILDAYACMKRCIGFVGNDSGLMHLAAASSIPTLGLFGPSPETVYSPWGKNCGWIRTDRTFDEIISDENYNYNSSQSNMFDLSVDKVEAAFLKLLKYHD